MATVISQLSSFVTAAIGWIGQYVTFITAEGHEIVLFFIMMPLVGLGIGLLKRLINIR